MSRTMQTIQPSTAAADNATAKEGKARRVVTDAAAPRMHADQVRVQAHAHEANMVHVCLGVCVCVCTFIHDNDARSKRMDRQYMRRRATSRSAG